MSPEDPALLAARRLVAAALSLGEDRIDARAALSSVPAWDSLGQLGVILAIEAALGTRIDDDATFERLTSVTGIAAYLRAMGAAGPDVPPDS